MVQQDGGEDGNSFLPMDFAFLQASPAPTSPIPRRKKSQRHIMELSGHIVYTVRFIVDRVGIGLLPSALPGIAAARGKQF